MEKAITGVEREAHDEELRCPLTLTLTLTLTLNELRCQLQDLLESLESIQEESSSHEEERKALKKDLKRAQSHVMELEREILRLTTAPHHESLPDRSPYLSRHDPDPYTDPYTDPYLGLYDVALISVGMSHRLSMRDRR